MNDESAHPRARDGDAAATVLHFVAALLGVRTAAFVFAPLFADTTTWGVLDWDAHSAYRVRAWPELFANGEGPWWNPWLCGGFPDWGYVEGATNVVSPFSALYALFPLNLAVRFEVVGSTCLAFAGAYVLALRYTKSAAWCCFVALGWAFNGRWFAQAAVGHTWHLQYAWLPFAWLCFDVALEEGRGRFAVGAGAALAMMVFMGGVYPLPHAALALALYAFVMVLATRSARPFGVLLVTGLSALGLAAPKLLPVLALSARFPRLVESTEAIDLHVLWVALTDGRNVLGHAPVPVPDWGWFEYGAYVGVVPVALIALGFFFARGARELALRIVGALFVVLSLGAFASHAPWVLLHRMPVFASQHVPSRFLFPALLFLLVATAASASRFTARVRWLEGALFVPLLALGLDLGSTGRASIERAFSFTAPEPNRATEFRQHRHAPGNWIAPDGRPLPVASRSALLGARANVGVVDCYGVPPGVGGALAVESPEYRGQVFVANGTGDAEVVAWTPNTATVAYRGMSPGAALVYDMNFDPGWRVAGATARSHEGMVSASGLQGSGSVTFSYRPPLLTEGLWIFALTCVAIGLARRRWPPAASPTATVAS